MSRDRISNLPDNVIDRILSCLQFRDAARTSVLSTKWRNKWSELPNLVFDSVSQPYTFQTRLDSTKLEIIIDHILLLHRGPILKFNLSHRENMNRKAIDRWITYVSRSPIKDLAVIFREAYCVPSCLFSCQSLASLSLRCYTGSNLCFCRIRLPRTYKGFPNLKSLDLCGVDISKDDLENLISSSPLLEKLVLALQTVLSHLTVSAPKLKYFCLFVSFFRGISFENTYTLNDVVLHNEYYIELDQNLQVSSNLFNFCAQLPTIRKLRINSRFMKYLVIGTGDTRLSCPSLDSLTLEINLNDIEDRSNAVCILSAFPNLRELKIQVNRVDKVKGGERVIKLWEDYDFPFLFTKLQYVEINGFGISGTCDELSFVKLMLTKLPVLEKMVVRHSIMDNVAKVLSLVEKLLNFRRSSDRAQVICLPKEEKPRSGF